VLDLPRISEAITVLPPGFDVKGRQPAPQELIGQLVDNVSTVVSYGKPFVVEPRQCRPLLKPVDAAKGADTIGFRGDRGKDEQISVGAIEPVTVPQPIPATGCDRMTFQVDDDDYPTSGTVERISVPTIEDATVIGLKALVEGSPFVEYSYTAILDGGGYVDVRTRLDASFQAEPVLPDLLTRAVAAVRGR
jgi:hypothetical protein